MYISGFFFLRCSFSHSSITYAYEVGKSINMPGEAGNRDVIMSRDKMQRECVCNVMIMWVMRYRNGAYDYNMVRTFEHETKVGY